MIFSTFKYLKILLLNIVLNKIKEIKVVQHNFILRLQLSVLVKDFVPQSTLNIIAV